MRYCTYCYKMIDTQKKHCPKCGGKFGEPQPGSPIFLTKKIMPWSGILKSVLEDNGIQFFTRELEGGGPEAIFGCVAEYLAFYVPYSRYEEALELSESVNISTFVEDDGEDSGEAEEGEAEEDNSEDENV